MSKQKTLVTLALLCAMALASEPIFAQAAQSSSGPGASPSASLDQDIKMLRADVQSSRKAITAENMNLTADEATKFWPIYDEYAAEVAKIGDDRVALIKDYAANYDTMTDDQANHFIEGGGYRPAVYCRPLEVCAAVREGHLLKEDGALVPDRPPPRPFDQPAIGVEYSRGAHHQLSAQQILEQGQYIETWSLGF